MPRQSEYQSHKEWSSTSRKPIVQRVSTPRPVIKVQTVINYLIGGLVASAFWYYYLTSAAP